MNRARSAVNTGNDRRRVGSGGYARDYVSPYAQARTLNQKRSYGEGDSNLASSLKRKYEENHEDADYRIGEVEMMSENAMPRALGPSK